MEELCIGRQKSSFQSFVAPGSIPRINLNNVNNDENEKHVDVDEEDEDDGRNDMFNKTAGGFISSLNSPFDQAIGNTSDAVSSCSLLNLNNNTTCFTSIKNKRVSEDHNIFNAESGVNRRHKRMMKNRESAARSRARRQVLFLSFFFPFFYFLFFTFYGVVLCVMLMSYYLLLNTKIFYQ